MLPRLKTSISLPFVKKNKLAYRLLKDICTKNERHSRPDYIIIIND